MTREHALAAALIGWLAGATATAADVAAARAECEREFRPTYAQSGKDVIWIPTPETLAARMLKMADVRPADLVVDLGSGDGKIAIAAARDFRARARGIEYDARMVRLAQCYATAERVDSRVEFVRGDIFALDFDDASVVTMYLLPELTMRLRPRLAQLRPGTRIVSNAYHLGDWGADETVRIPVGTAYLWIVPAQAAGQWRLAGPDGTEYGLSIAQAHQRVTAKLAAPGAATPLDAEGRLRGVELELGARSGPRWSLEAAVNGDRLQGTLKFAGRSIPVTGTRLASR
ncbi:MAG: class I SAM-dependent methyltransferase [Steroidobacteraceae bacterium]|nr:class I SAM-dependent methyltransferase [Steroidobacteraceae bacterium]